jgi:tetratricopeptide (TPR) repeat protein
MTLSAVALGPLDASADEATASDHARKAQVAYDLQNWETAAKEFEAAYQADQRPEYLWSLAQVQRLRGDCRAAIRSYKAFQRAEVTANQANTAEMMVTKCEAEIAKQEAMEAQARAAAPPPEQDKPQEPSPSPPSAKPEPVEESSGGLGVGWFITGVGLTLAVGATATWSGLDVRSQRENYEENPTRDSYVAGKDDERRTNILLGATAVAAVGTGLIAIFTDWSGDSTSREQGLRLRPGVAADGGALLLTGAF